MKTLINNIYHLKNIEIDMFEVWQEVLKHKDKIIEVVNKLSKGKIINRLKNFWRNYKVHIMVAGLVLMLWGLGALPISIFIFIL